MGELTSCCLDSSQKKVLLGDHEGLAKSYNYLNGQEKRVFAGLNGQATAHRSEVSKIVYCAEHSVFVMASWDRTITVYDDADVQNDPHAREQQPKSGDDQQQQQPKHSHSAQAQSGLLRTMSGGHEADVLALAVSARLGLIASGSSDGEIVVWSLEFGRLEGLCGPVLAAVSALAFVDPFAALLSADGQGAFHLWCVGDSPLRFECLAAWRNDGAAFRWAQRPIRHNGRGFGTFEVCESGVRLVSGEPRTEGVLEKSRGHVLSSALGEPLDRTRIGPSETSRRYRDIAACGTGPPPASSDASAEQQPATTHAAIGCVSLTTHYTKAADERDDDDDSDAADDEAEDEDEDEEAQNRAKPPPPPPALAPPRPRPPTSDRSVRSVGSTLRHTTRHPRILSRHARFLHQKCATRFFLFLERA